MNTLAIIGAGGHGRVVADIALQCKRWENILFFDDNFVGYTLEGTTLAGNVQSAKVYRESADFFVAIGDNLERSRLFNKLENWGCSLITLIHPNAVIGKNVKIGKGSVLMAGVIVNCESTIGSGCIINTKSCLDHNNLIEDFVHISPGVTLAGTVCVGSKTWIGIGASISNNITICADTIIGAGAVVIKSIEISGTYIGVPAHLI